MQATLSGHRRRILTSEALRHPSQSQTATLCESPAAIYTAPKLLPVLSGPDLCSIVMKLLPAELGPRQAPHRCFPFSFGPECFPIHVCQDPRQPRSEHLSGRTMLRVPICRTQHELPQLRARKVAPPACKSYPASLKVAKAWSGRFVGTKMCTERHS